MSWSFTEQEYLILPAPTLTPAMVSLGFSFRGYFHMYVSTFMPREMESLNTVLSAYDVADLSLREMYRPSLMA